MLKVIQIQASNKNKDVDINNLLKSAGVKRIHDGWYSLWYNGIIPDSSNVVKAKRNRGGKIKQEKSNEKTFSIRTSRRSYRF